MPRQLFPALLKVHVGILLSADARNPAVQMLPDLLWALWSSFTVRLSMCARGAPVLTGLNLTSLIGAFLKWLVTLIVAREDVHLRRGVSQGSILGPLFLFLHMLRPCVIIPTHNLRFHCYADEVHMYPPEMLTEPLHHCPNAVFHHLN